jgi:hypothetical protein
MSSAYLIPKFLLFNPTGEGNIIALINSFMMKVFFTEFLVPIPPHKMASPNENIGISSKQASLFLPIPLFQFGFGMRHFSLLFI